MSYPVKVGNYLIKRTLGQGAYGKVKLGLNEATGQCVAVKVLNKRTVRQLAMQEKVKREVKAMRGIEHPHVVSLIQVIDTPADIFLVLELASHGDLYDKIINSGRLCESEARDLFWQLAAGVSHIHSRGVAHRDLKLENVLFDDFGNLKVADFGLCNTFAKDGQTLLKTACGSPDYAAPEIVKHQAYCGAKADAWSCGVILFAMLTAMLPFDEENQGRLFERIVKGDFSFPKSVLLTPEAKDLVTSLLTVDPAARISISEIFEHPWMTNEANAATSSPSPQQQRLVYGENWPKFLASKQLCLRPKRVENLDTELVMQLRKVETLYQTTQIQSSIPEILATYYTNHHRSKVQKELGADAWAVTSLCAAYKILLLRKLLKVCSKERKRVQKCDLTQNDQFSPQIQQQPIEHQIKDFEDPFENKVSKAPQKIDTEINQLSDKFRNLFTDVRLKTQAPKQTDPKAQTEDSEPSPFAETLKFRSSTEGIKEVLTSVCEALKDSNLSWKQVSDQESTTKAHIRVISATNDTCTKKPPSKPFFDIFVFTDPVPPASSTENPDDTIPSSYSHYYVKVKVSQKRHQKMAVHRKRRGGSHENPEMQTIEKVAKFNENLCRKLKRVRTGSFDNTHKQRGSVYVKPPSFGTVQTQKQDKMVLAPSKTKSSLVYQPKTIPNPTPNFGLQSQSFGEGEKDSGQLKEIGQVQQQKLLGGQTVSTLDTLDSRETMGGTTFGESPSFEKAKGQEGISASPSTSPPGKNIVLFNHSGSFSQALL